jgi:glycosyltransferase involved in cell wall biosynthesis
MPSTTLAAGERPRIAFFHPYPHRMGGSQQVALILARRLPAMGYEPVMICPEDGRFTTAARAAGIKVVICTPGPSWRVYGRGDGGISNWLSLRHAYELISYWLELRAVLRKHRIALLHCHTVRAVVMAARAGQLAQVPTLWHVHGAPPAGPAGWLVSRFASAARYWVFVSAGMLQHWKPRSSNRRSLHVIHNGIDEIPLAEPVDRDRSRPLIVTVGTLSPVKGQDLLLAALPAVLKHIANAQCWLVGKDWADGTYQQRLHHLVERLSLSHCVELLGEREDVPRLIATSDCVVVPSRSESFGMVALEAMAQRKPVVAAATGGLRDIVVDNETGFLVSAADENALAEAVIKILSGNGLAKRMGEAGRRRALERFSAAQMSERFRALYDSILCTESATGPMR